MKALLVALVLLSAPAVTRADPAEDRALLTRALAPDKLGFRAGEATIAMQLRDAAGRVVERTLRARTATGAGARKMRLTFLEPIDQRGVELLVIERDGRPAEQTMWLPRARELRVITPGDRGAGLEGSDFTFEDLERRELGGATITPLGEETIGGLPCVRLEATGLPGRFGRVRFWVARAHDIPLRVEFYARDAAGAADAPARRFEVKRLQKVDGRLTPTRLVMADAVAGTQTTIDLSGFVDVALPDSLFPPDALGR